MLDDNFERSLGALQNTLTTDHSKCIGGKQNS